MSRVSLLIISSDLEKRDARVSIFPADLYVYGCVYVCSLQFDQQRSKSAN